MPQLRHHSHLRYATPASAAYPAVRAGRWRTRAFSIPVPQRVPRRPSAQAAKGILIAAPISLALWVAIAMLVRLFL